MHTYENKKSKAFTLIELLVVIAIIAILAAILFPVFAQARERARRASCLSNMKQLGMALQMYVDDYDNLVPPREYTIAGDANYDYQLFVGGKRKKGTSGATAVWYPEFGLLQPYIKSVQVTTCPSSTDLNIRQPYEISAPGQPQGYGYNQSYLFPGTNPPPNTVAIEKPSETVFLTDSAYALNASTLQTWTGNWAPSVGYPTVHGRHQGFANIAWADGHAKALRVTYRTTADFPAASVEIWSKFNVGDLIHSAYPKGSTYQNYYYLLDKPD
ncbi:DUF1559 domain-containing protein [bacterium]|nr:MAG: DUF1559 domain-containing protein [bacterium]